MGRGECYAQGNVANSLTGTVSDNDNPTNNKLVHVR